MSTTNYLAVDLGSTSGRTVLATFNGEKIEMKELTRFKNPIIPLGGHMYWNLPHLYNAVIECSANRIVVFPGIGR